MERARDIVGTSVLVISAFITASATAISIAIVLAVAAVGSPSALVKIMLDFQQHVA
jgi:hypothetical protein